MWVPWPLLSTRAVAGLPASGDRSTAATTLPSPIKPSTGATPVSITATLIPAPVMPCSHSDTGADLVDDVIHRAERQVSGVDGGLHGRLDRRRSGRFVGAGRSDQEGSCSESGNNGDGCNGSPSRWLRCGIVARDPAGSAGRRSVDHRSAGECQGGKHRARHVVSVRDAPGGASLRVPRRRPTAERPLTGARIYLDERS